MFGNVSWGREASNHPVSPPQEQLTPRRVGGSELPPRSTRSTPATTRGASKGAVMVSCAGWALGCQVERPGGGGESSGVPEATQTPTSPPSAYAGAAPDPPARRHCPPTRPRAGQRSPDSERESPKALPARRCAELGL